MKRLVALFAIAIAPLGCKRDAHEKIPASALFPKATNVADDASDPAFGAMIRAVEVSEAEPNDSIAKAQQLPAAAVVKGTVGPPGDVPGAVDFFAIPGHPGPATVARIELLDAPRCAEVAVLQPGATDVVQAGRVDRAGRLVLDSLALTAAGLVVRVSCVQDASKRAAVGGTYRLKTAQRGRTAGEEAEPNDRHSAKDPILAISPPAENGGANLPVQGALSHVGDVDVFAIRVDTAPSPRAPLTLAVAGVPGVVMRLELRTSSGQLRLKRTSKRGHSITIPNLAAGLMGNVAEMALTALSGAQPDHRYAVALTATAPCPTGGACPGHHVVEREPNDRRDDAMMLRFDRRATGLIDGRGDVDWYAIDVVAGTAVGVVLTPPPGVRAKLMVTSPPTESSWVIGPHEGGKAEVMRYVAGGERVFIRVMGVKGSHDAKQPYGIEVANISAVEAALDLSGVITPTVAAAITPTTSAPPAVTVP